MSREGVPEIRNRQQAGAKLRQLRGQMAELGRSTWAIEEVERLEGLTEVSVHAARDLAGAQGPPQVIAEIDSRRAAVHHRVASPGVQRDLCAPLRRGRRPSGSRMNPMCSRAASDRGAASREEAAKHALSGGERG